MLYLTYVSILLPHFFVKVTFDLSHQYLSSQYLTFAIKSTCPAKYKSGYYLFIIFYKAYTNLGKNRKFMCNKTLNTFKIKQKNRAKRKTQKAEKMKTTCS
jgi:hypothetical protein